MKLISYDSDEVYRNGVCEYCSLLLSEAPTMVTLFYFVGGVRPVYHKACYETIRDSLPSPVELYLKLEERASKWSTV